MLGLARGEIEATPSVREHLDLCMDCRACETACPSGVVYHELIEETRARMTQNTARTMQGRLMRWIFFHVFTKPTRLKLALLPARIMQKVGLYALLRKIGIFRLLPLQLRKMEQMLPASGALWPRQLPEFVAGARMKEKREREPDAIVAKSIGFFAGCIGAVVV